MYPYRGVDLCMVPYEALTDTCIRLLSDREKIEALGQRTYGQFKEAYPMTSILKSALQKIGKEIVDR